ncbi:MAG: signal peptide peptidase SppA [Bacteroidota bacterium]|jgi:protease-4
MSENRISFSKLFWPSFLAVFVAGLVGMVFFFLVLGGIIGSFGDFDPEPLALQDKTVLHLKLEGTIADKSSQSIDATAMEVTRTAGLPEMIVGLEEASKDSKIKGVFLEMNNPELGMASAQELRQALERFKKSGKFIVAYLSGEQIAYTDYYLSSVATEIYGAAGSTFLWSGLHAESFFLKNLLDELQIGVMVIRGKDNEFKSAVEPFYRSNMSDSSRRQMTTLLTDIWKVTRNEIASTRKLDTLELDTLANQLAIRRLKHAKDFHLIDDVLYRNEVLSLLKKKVGLEQTAALRLQAFGKYMRDTFYKDQLLAKQEKHVAVILAEGDVVSEGEGVSAATLGKLLRGVRADKNVKAIVLRINSPGGSALASEAIWKEVQLTAAAKPLYVSMGDLAASGGYYIACPAKRIFAQPATITGSIGVFGMIPNAGKFLENKLGITTDEVRTHQHGGLSIVRPLSPEEYNFMQIEIDEVYDLFLERVSSGRKLSKVQVHQIARGRVWTGFSAKQIGLIDDFGGLYAAMSSAKNAAHCSSVVFYPKKEQSAFDQLIDLVDEEFDSEQTKVKVSMPSELLRYYQKYEQIKHMSGIQMRLPFEIRMY